VKRPAPSSGGTSSPPDHALFPFANAPTELAVTQPWRTAVPEQEPDTLPAESAPPWAAEPPVFVVPTGRGGRGKTWWARWAVGRALARGREVVIVDADRIKPTLAAYFDGVLTPSSADEAGMREWFAALVERQIADRFSLLLDFGGGDLLLKQLARETGLVDVLESRGIRTVAVHFLGPDCDDLAYLHVMERDGLFAPAATILVLNEALVSAGRAIGTAFQSTILEHPIFLAALERGARSVWMPPLEPAHEIDVRRLTFTAARDNRVKPGQAAIGPWKRQLIHNWLRDMETNFAPVGDWLP
jgi:hypothetical protein